MCPFLILGEMIEAAITQSKYDPSAAVCDEECCAWYDDENECCAILTLARKGGSGNEAAEG